MREQDQLTISQLRQGVQNTEIAKSPKEVSISDIAAPEDKTESVRQQFVGDLLGGIDAKINSVAKESIEYRKKLQEEEFENEGEEEFENEDSQSSNEESAKVVTPFRETNTVTTPFVDEEDEDEEEVPTKNVETHEIKDISQDSLKINEDDFDDEDDEDEETEPDNEKVEENIRGLLKKKLKSSMNVIDMNSFTIAKEPVTITNALSTIPSNAHIANWALTASETTISVKEFKGTELDNIMERSGLNRYAEQDRIFKIIYDHIVTADKPIYDTWRKTFNFFDMDDLYFAIYIACFENANYMPYQCPKCKHAFVSDNLPIEDLIKFKNKDSENKIKNILINNLTQPKKFEVEIVQVSNDYAIGLKEPSLYDIVFQNAILDENFVRKYSDLLTITSFIDSIYVIDREKSQLRPIELKVYENNEAKTIKSKIRRFAKIIQTLSSDQYQQLSEYISAIGKNYDDVKYVIPETTCPKCGEKISEEEVDSRNLVFIRHQLTGPTLA